MNRGLSDAGKHGTDHSRHSASRQHNRIHRDNKPNLRDQCRCRCFLQHAAGSFDLSLQSGGTIDTHTLFTITSNANNLTLNSTAAAGTSIKMGAVVDTSGNISVTGTNIVTLTTGIAPTSGGSVTVSSANSTVEIDGAVSSTGNVSITQNSATPLTVNAPATGAGNLNGTVSGATVTLINFGSGGVIFSGAGTAVTATNLGVNGGTGASAPMLLEMADSALLISCFSLHQELVRLLERFR